MVARSIKRLEELVRTDLSVAPLAMLQAEVLRAVDAPGWAEDAPGFAYSPCLETLADRSWGWEGATSSGEAPLLHGRTLLVDAHRFRDLLARLAATAEGAVGSAVRSLGPVLEDPAFDVAALLEASIGQDADRLAALATELRVRPPLLATLGHLAALPLLQACGRKAAPRLEDLPWESGYCPVCGAWPTLAEVRGTWRERWLRCGRCGAEWRCSHQECAFCGNRDHRTLGYLAAEADREARRADTCDRCHGYLKSVASAVPMGPAEVAVHDLATVELDVAALERGYGRPQSPGFPLQVTVAAS